MRAWFSRRKNSKRGKYWVQFDSDTQARKYKIVQGFSLSIFSDTRFLESKKNTKNDLRWSALCFLKMMTWLSCYRYSCMEPMNTSLYPWIWYYSREIQPDTFSICYQDISRIWKCKKILQPSEMWSNRTDSGSDIWMKKTKYKGRGTMEDSKTSHIRDMWKSMISGNIWVNYRSILR